MITSKPDIVILTEDRYAVIDDTDWYQGQIAREEALLEAALRRQGLGVVRRSWSDPGMDW